MASLLTPGESVVNASGSTGVPDLTSSEVFVMNGSGIGANAQRRRLQTEETDTTEAGDEYDPLFNNV